MQLIILLFAPFGEEGQGGGFGDFDGNEFADQRLGTVEDDDVVAGSAGDELGVVVIVALVEVGFFLLGPSTRTSRVWPRKRLLSSFGDFADDIEQFDIFFPV